MVKGIVDKPIKYRLLIQDVIEEFHESYRGNFPNETVKPKFHFTLQNKFWSISSYANTSI